MSTERDITATDGYFVGEDKALVFTVKDAVGAAANITGWTIRFELSDLNDQFGHEILTKTATLTSPGSGICTVIVASDDTIELEPGTYYYTLRRTDAGARTELAYGSLVLLDTWTDNP